MSRIAAEDGLSRQPTIPATHAQVAAVTAPGRARGSGLLSAAVAICLILAVANVGLLTLFAAQNPGVVDFISGPTWPNLHATGLILLDEVNEQPHIAAAPPAVDDVPFCKGFNDRYRTALIQAFALMGGSDEGRRLYATMVRHDVCVAVQDIPYNGGYATSWRSSSGDWFHGTITIDDGYVRSRQADVLAAMLVHEATHIDRAINGESCDDRTDCEVLANGVELEEEVAAHAAEARWWIAAYLNDGKRFAFGPDFGENRLASAYLDGPGAFRAYVRDLRSNPREGAGI